MGFVVLAGLAEPGSSVSLYSVPDETVLRVDAGASLVGRRLADSTGSVGFDGLESGGRFIARFYLGGVPQEVRCRAIEASEGSELAQASPPLPPNPVGTQEEVVAPVPPADPFAMLQVGVPAGVPLGVAQAA